MNRGDTNNNRQLLWGRRQQQREQRGKYSTFKVKGIVVLTTSAVGRRPVPVLQFDSIKVSEPAAASVYVIM
uniref:Uncharacterized protein n=1 Tax=Romanomermis culicivorax TaxID=13658 RepID=A0A915JD68_ROMCU